MGKHYSVRTEQTYIDWIKRFIVLHGKQHSETIGADGDAGLFTVVLALWDYLVEIVADRSPIIKEIENDVV